MLLLPEDWKRFSTPFVITQLLRQSRKIGEYAAVARLLVIASLEMLRDGQRNRDGDHEPTWTMLIDGRFIRINDYAWIIVDELNDLLLDDVKRLLETAHEVQLLVPPWTATLLRRAFTRDEPRATVRGVDEYVGFRILMSPHCDQPNALSAFEELIDRYGALCEAHQLDHLVIASHPSHAPSVNG